MTVALCFLQDFTLCIWRVYDWQCVHILGGHKDTITDFSIHPTGKMALSVSKDHTLKLWNLVQGTLVSSVSCRFQPDDNFFLWHLGRCAFTRRLKQPTDQVIWHSTGDYYLLVSTKDIQVCLVANFAHTRTQELCLPPTHMHYRYSDIAIQGSRQLLPDHTHPRQSHQPRLLHLRGTRQSGQSGRKGRRCAVEDGDRL
jgi:WD40 repeat protein